MQVKPHLRPDGVLVGLQNAMTKADVVGTSRTVGPVIKMAAEIFTSEHAKRPTPAEGAWFRLGAMDPGQPNFSPAEFTSSFQSWIGSSEAREIRRAIQMDFAPQRRLAKQRRTGSRGAAPLLRPIDITTWDSAPRVMY